MNLSYCANPFARFYNLKYEKDSLTFWIMKLVISAQNVFFLPKIVKTIRVINNYSKGFGREWGLLP